MINTHGVIRLNDSSVTFAIIGGPAGATRLAQLVPCRCQYGQVLKHRDWKPVMNDVNELHESLASVVHADRELADVLTEITGIARRAMPSIEAASVTLIGGEKPFTAAYLTGRWLWTLTSCSTTPGPARFHHYLAALNR